jgi:mannose-6-phosphate isomerase-like protein (cupin superfamily)
MKRVSILFAATLFCLVFTVQVGHTQNFFKNNPGLCKILGDTTFTTTAEVTFMPGQKSTVHTHAAQFIYALTDGALTVHFSDGKVEKFELKAGDSFVAPAERPHWSENLGKKPLKFILVEYNDHPYKDMMVK